MIDRACAEHGWARPPWKTAVRAKLQEEPWATDSDDADDPSDVWDMINELRCVPDAWRLRVEGAEAGWFHPVLVLEFLEVEVTHPVPDVKLVEYDTLWRRLDATEDYHLRVLRMDKYGIISPLTTEGTAYEILGYLYGPDGRRAVDDKGEGRAPAV